jgi:hypothetical protein
MLRHSGENAVLVLGESIALRPLDAVAAEADRVVAVLALERFVGRSLAAEGIGSSAD